MITTAELHRVAAREGLRFDQAEKDYVILLLLSGISPLVGGRHQWAFKGGTCLRHCYYPGYRFSEDMDFTCARINEDVGEALALLNQAAQAISDGTGVLLRLGEPPGDEGNAQVEIPVEYSRGGPRRQSLPTVRVHLTFDEPLLTLPEEGLL